ncbi:hypothetical protein PO820_003661 [Cronobacter sakazakii]|nr:hypothetical protein [Cronobacter sakazakii]ELY5945167.1 hypothetical protein [Cronobacter turicensis]EKK7733337.1 hypothetical protein [Cronobacter sakazakii]ELY4123900.1 hypothetical protein [Cronobacter sakazakii]ELY6251548.1 hypothetical protein [Cronobacter sakazakii]
MLSVYKVTFRFLTGQRASRCPVCGERLFYKTSRCPGCRAATLRPDNLYELFR